MSFLAHVFNRPYEHLLTDEDISYNEQSTLDVYVDPHVEASSRPVLIFWYGGSWTDGSKELYRFVADWLARSTGAMVVVPDYRKYPNVQFPVFASEAWDVVQWVKANASRYGGDPTNYSVIGHSAGGHTAGLVALGAYRPEGLPLPKRCVLLAAPNCFVGKGLYDIFGSYREQHQAFPVDFIERIDADYATEFLLLQGRYDHVIYPRQQTDFLGALQAKGIAASYYPTKTTHVSQVMSIGSPFAHFTQSARLVRQFLVR